MKDRKIQRFFQKAKRKIVKNLLLQNLIIFATIGLLVGTGIHVAALLFPIYGSLYWAIMAVGMTMVIGLLYTIICCPNNREIALIIDSKGLEEQLVTSMELKGKEDVISSLQKQRTLDAISQYSIKERLPYKWSLTNMLLLFFSALAFLIAAIMPSDTKSQAVALHELEKVVKEEKDKVEEVKKEVAALEEASEAELAELQKILEESMKEISEAKKEQELEKAKERLETKLEKELEKQDSELSEQLSEILEKKDIIKKTAEEKEQEEQEKALKEQLEQLQQQLALSKENEQSEQSQEETKGNGETDGNKSKNENSSGENGSQGSESNSAELMELSEQIQQAASNGLLSAQEMQQLAQSVAQANNALANTNLSNQQLQALSGQMSQMLASSGNASVSNGATASIGNSSGSNGSNGNNGSNGSGSGGSGNNSNGGGTSGNGQGGNGSGGGYNHGSKNGVEKDYVKNTSEEVTVPGDVGDDENLTGKSGGKGQSYTQKSKNGLAWAGNSVNYSQVVGNYANQAYSDVENNKVPDSMKEIVKSYFAGLTN